MGGLVVGRWVAKLVVRLLVKAAPWVRIRTSIKIKKWATTAQEWQKHCNTSKNIQKTDIYNFAKTKPECCD
jgi:hypothetical protein